MMRLLLLLLLLAPGQDAAITSLIDRWRAEDFSEREKATEEMLSRWKEWKAADLTALDRAGSSDDREIAGRAREVLKRLRVRIAAGVAIVESVPDFDKIVLEGTSTQRIFLLSAVARRWQRKEAADADLGRVMEVARHWGLSDRDLLWVVSRGRVAPWASLIVPMLKSEHGGIRRDTALALGAMGARDQAKAIFDLLLDEDWDVRSGAAEALGILKASNLLGDAVVLLAHKEAGIRRSAVVAVGALGGGRTTLTPLTADDDSLVRIAAIRTLGPAAPEEIRKRLGDPVEDVRVAVVECGQLDLETLHPLLKDPSARVRTAAVKAVGRHRSRESVVLLLPLLRNTDGPTRRASGEALVLCRAEWKDLVPLLRETDEAVRSVAVDVLCALRDRAAAPSVRKLLDHEVAGVRCSAIEALSGLLGREAGTGIAPLLKDADSEVRLVALRAFAVAGDRRVAVEAAALLKDPELREYALEVLSLMGTPETAKLILPLLDDQEPAVRLRALHALQMIGDPSCLESVSRLLKDDTISNDAVLALLRLRGDAALALPSRGWMLESDLAILARQATPKQLDALRLESSNAIRLIALAGMRTKVDALLPLLRRSGFQQDVVRALGMLGAIDAAPAVAEFLMNADDDARAEAALSLGKMGSSAHGPLLAVLLRDPVGEVRRAAARALGDLGGVSFTADLVDAMGDPDPYVACRAIEALGRIGARQAAPEIARRAADPTFASWCAVALAELDAREQVDAIRPALKIPGWPGACAAWMLAELGQPLKTLDLPNARLPRIAGRAALLRSGTLDADGRRAMLDDIIVMRFFANSALARGALAAFIDPAKLRIDVELKKPVGTPEEAAALLTSCGFKIEGPIRFTGRLDSGTKISIRRVLERLCEGDEVVVIDEGTLRVMSAMDAVRFWAKK